jgi:hypothetical protein
MKMEMKMQMEMEMEVCGVVERLIVWRGDRGRLDKIVRLHRPVEMYPGIHLPYITYKVPRYIYDIHMYSVGICLTYILRCRIRHILAY